MAIPSDGIFESCLRKDKLEKKLLGQQREQYLDLKARGTARSKDNFYVFGVL